MTPYGRREARDAVAYWRRELGLTDWTVQVVFAKMAHRLTCEALPEYRELNFTFNLPAMHAKGDKLHRSIVHEYAHILPWDLAEFAQLEIKRQHDPVKDRLFEKLEEATTTAIEHLILRLHPPPEDV